MTDTMNEFVIEWIKGEKTAGFTIPNSTRFKTKVIELIKKNNDGDYIENTDGSVYARIPVEWIHIYPKRKVSDEQKEIARQRMKGIAEKRWKKDQPKE